MVLILSIIILFVRKTIGKNMRTRKSYRSWRLHYTFLLLVAVHPLSLQLADGAEVKQTGPVIPEQLARPTSVLLLTVGQVQQMTRPPLTQEQLTLAWPASQAAVKQIWVGHAVDTAGTDQLVLNESVK